jgi:hypothetical protein
MMIFAQSKDHHCNILNFFSTTLPTGRKVYVGKENNFSGSERVQPMQHGLNGWREKPGKVALSKKFISMRR